MTETTNSAVSVPDTMPAPGMTRATAVLPVLPKAGTPIAADDVLRIETAVTKDIAWVEDLDVLQEWRAKAAALEAYLRSKGLQRPMLGAQRRVEARIGQLLEEPSRGGRGKTSDYGRDFRDALTDFRVLARAFECLGDDDEWRKSRRALVSLVRQKLGLTLEAPPLPEGQFRCIVADPPWRLTTGPEVFNGTGERGGQPLPYEQMSLEEISALPVEKSAADDSHLYLWTTNRYVEAAYSVARAWGFKPSTLLVWAKTPRGVGLGDTYRLTTEFVLYARRGSLREKCVIETSWFNWPRGRHSVKPEKFYHMVETVNHAPFLEMFARKPRSGWTVWGNEVCEQTLQQPAG